ncbi:MAG: hypothetical protein A2175_01035 [Candidatus Nealsonbacteria bacterium RBG_13_42_11]|uniref:DegT/DnrJ/EryC1/StrS aminotransferase n=1 Tax=Candidatus Nealsonbacteria bacterium RBG_13_42_11 TaxID=1801663 RepID=A0A1G2DYA4_9BACT|nr:MAG: hypothetical protein A2175_01035 [Candidatus Nealsonbacteria bacterium RBG_13_42_11]
MNQIKPISISLSPNTQPDDIRLAFGLKFKPCKWREGKEIDELENQFKNYLGVKYAASFNSGRSSLMAILNALELEKGSEVLLQAFTCNAAANPIIWSGLNPVYVDVNEQTFNIDSEDLRRKISAKSRVVIVQHTFGLPAEMDEIAEICQEHNLILIEDCAHSLGAEYSPPHQNSGGGGKGKKIGTFGKAAFFSFSRDKVISSVYGGMVTTNSDELARKIREYQERIGFPSYCWIAQQLLHPVLMNWLILPTYRPLGKYLLVMLQRLHILSKAVHWKEKRGRIPGYFPRRLPNALATLGLNQFKKLEKFNRHRKEIAEFYRQELKNTRLELSPEREQIYLRFTVKHPKAHEIIRKAWNSNILIGDWYTTALAPYDTELERMQYVMGSCPAAEKLAEETLNLPTHINITEEEARRVVGFLKQWS